MSPAQSNESDRIEHEAEPGAADRVASGIPRLDYIL
jgi:hypothetical protein